MKIKAIKLPTVVRWKLSVSFPDGKGFEASVEFYPVENTPGFTHRVGINGQPPKFWLGDNAKPGKKAATFFIQKHLDSNT